ncbi:hypothetical protein [Ornithinibacillus halophilus]|uniref:Uncharacterized protein n=1 Tax=Ornithinibacillus halophilus TaxID=930117 RepID=A0A1M5IH37_9BACI|nr:hypothetical protein [Ornithinibacillus halophilus]SHG27565.1 hypothetical protein SAMN05216225_102411 [Ornithinibacillus halophilus]
MKKLMILLIVLISFHVVIAKEIQASEGTSHMILIPPENPYYPMPILEYDFNHDSQVEYLIPFTNEKYNEYGVSLWLKSEHTGIKKWETKQRGIGLSYSALVDLTGDDVKEYLFGVKIGASAGNILSVFERKGNHLEKRAEWNYHMIEPFEGGIALWDRILADAYIVDVLKWNGEKFVFDEQLFSEYYPTIEIFYKEKIQKLDAWFYWYALADAQIKANEIQKARNSINYGISLAEQLGMPDVVDKFKDFKEQVQNH